MDVELFVNREEAGRQLGLRVSASELRHPIVLGIPRGGIPIAVAVARYLPDADTGVVVARKLGAPGHPELAIGAVTANGAYFLDEELVHQVGASDRYVTEELRRQKVEALRRQEEFNGHRTPPVQGRNVVIVDDGVATGATAIAAIRATKGAGARFVLFAVPVGPADTISRLQQEADEVISLYEPEHFRAVGLYYRDFRPVLDVEALKLLDGVTTGD